MKYLKGLIIVMTFSFLNLSAQAEITSAKTMKEVVSVLKSYKPEELFVTVDIDMTLIQPDHPAVYYSALRKYIDTYKEIMGKLLPEQKDLISTLLTQTFPQRLVEKETPNLLKKLQENGVKVIALTSSLAGQVDGFREDMVVRRQEQLEKMGFDFSQSFSSLLEDKTFQNFKEYAGTTPRFYKGVLSTNGEGDASKGDVLIAFLEAINSHPKVVVLIDDKKKHLEVMEKKLHAYDPSLKFIGIEYEGAYSYAPEKVSKESFQQFWKELAHKVQPLK